MTQSPRAKIRRWKEEDLPEIIALQKRAWSDYPDSEQYGERVFGLQLGAFPDGQLLAELDGQIVGYCTALIVQLADEPEAYTFDEITGGGTFSTHSPGGDTLYGAEIAVDPAYRGRGIAGLLYEHRKKLLRRFNLRRMIAFGRIPGYREVAGQCTAREYVDDVTAGKRRDSALSAHLKAGYRVRQVRLDLMSDDASSNWATLLELENEDFLPARRRIAASPIRRAFRKMRVCAAQYLMRPVKNWTEFEETVDFFVSAAHEYHSHLLILPELFTAQLFSTMPDDLEPRKAMRKLARMTPRYLEMFKRFATENQLYIVGGSQPVLRDGTLYNVAHLFTPAGNVYTQDKLHITPEEREQWGIRPGEGVNLFETPFGRFGIQVCYDIEFPEVSRMLTLAGAEAIFVPFSTDDRKAYQRVRYSAHARAVENTIYVALAGNAGNLPTHLYLLNYSQSAVVTPSDFGFPPHAVAAEADPNCETVAIADLDFAALAQNREFGSVRPLHDRRPDLYSIRPEVRVRRIRGE